MFDIVDHGVSRLTKRAEPRSRPAILPKEQHVIPQARCLDASSPYFASIRTLMHDIDMRTSVTLDDEVYQLTSQYAAAKGVTLGAAIGELVRRGHSRSSQTAPVRRSRNGFPMFSRRGTVLTAQMVKDAQEDDPE